MGRSLILPFAVILLCALAVHCRRFPDRRPPGGIRTRPTTEAPTTTSPPGASAAGRRSMAAAAAKDRRGKGINRAAAAADTRGKPTRITLSNLPARSPVKNSETPGYTGPLPDQAQTPYGVFQIIDGKVTIFGHTYLFCDNAFYLEGIYICCNNVPLPQSAEDPVACCGLDYYFPKREICCEGFYYNKYENGYEAQCCKDIYYLPAIETCCNGDFRPKSDWGCCNENWYHRDISECCSGIEHPLVASHQCCGPYYHSPDFVCCNEEPFHKAFRGCCKGKHYIHLTYKCCPNGSIIKKNQNCY